MLWLAALEGSILAEVEADSLLRVCLSNGGHIAESPAALTGIREAYTTMNSSGRMTFCGSGSAMASGASIWGHKQQSALAGSMHW